MRWSEKFIAVDWGTTNRRAYLIDRGGQLLDEMSDGCGVLAVDPGQFGEAVEQIRQRLGRHPLLLAGMAGSTRGWVEAPYLPCPATIGDLVKALTWAEPRTTAIVPGVGYRDGEQADVMRGEEVQILGAAESGLIPPDCLVCHPGTHNKWVRIDKAAITAFRTVMTGEMFNLLRQHSILSEQLQGKAEPGDAFCKGVHRGLHAEVLTAEIFSVRARSLLGALNREEAGAFASGLLIGADVAFGLRTMPDRPIIVMGSPELTALYAQALRLAGKDVRLVDGDEAFLAGATRIGERIE